MANRNFKGQTCHGRRAHDAPKQGVFKGDLVERKIGARFFCHVDTINLSKGQTDLPFRWLQAHAKSGLEERTGEGGSVCVVPKHRNSQLPGWGVTA